MKISPIQPWTNLLKNNENNKNVNSSFGAILQNAIEDINELQLDADDKAVNFSLGNPNVDIHDVMISMEKAQLALSLTIEIRNKLVESYQEIMRMQV